MTIVVQNVVSKCGCVFDSPLFENNFPCPAVRAMQSHRGKRMRTLASQLLGGSDDERPPHDDTPLDRKDEISKLKKRIQDLDLQLSSLKEKNAGLRGKLAQVSLQLLEAQKISIAIGGEPGVRGLPWAATSWLDDNPHLLDLPRMDGFLRQLERSQLCCHEEICFELCKQNENTASRILRHCEWVICSLFRKKPAVYKIGITENVINRWNGKLYSYKRDPHDDWQQLVVLYVGSDSVQCGLIEAHLIDRFRGRSGCRNVLRGGETAKPGPGPFFTYVVWRKA